MQPTTNTEQARMDHIKATFATLLAKLPKGFDRGRVALRESAMSLRVYLDGNLISDHAFTFNFGWMPYESGLYAGRDGERVYRAMKAAMKAHPHNR